MNINSMARHVLLAGLAAMTGNSLAQEGVLEEVIVTAQKRPENIQDVAISITAFSGERVRELGLTKNVDLGNQTPGLLFAEGSEQLISVTSLRGVSQNDVSFHLEPPNAVYLDNAYISILSASNFQMYDLERVEILRGPQGTLFGRNATGGLLHFLTRPPSPEPGGYGDLQIGENSQVRFEGAVGGSITNAVSARISALTDSYDGYAFNTTMGREFRGRDESGVRGQLQFEPGVDLAIRMIGFYHEQDTDLGFKHSANGFDPDGLMFTLPADLNFWGRCPGCDPSGHRDSSDDPFVSEFDAAGFFNSETTGFTGIVDWNFGDLLLTSVTHYLEYEAEHLEDGELAPRPGFNLNSSQNSNNFTQELRLSGSTTWTRWMAGVYFIKRDASSAQSIDVNLQYFDDVLSVFGLIPPGFIAGLGTTDNMLSVWSMETASRALFGQVEHDLSPAWTLVAGLRYTDDDLDYKFKSTETIDGYPIGPGGILGETEAVDSKAESDWSGKLGLEWRPNDHWMAYAQFSRGTKSGGWNAPFLGGEVSEFGSETLDSLELGFKSTLMDGRARLNAAVFHYDYKDYQGFTFVDFAAKVSNLDAEVSGLEAELTLSPGSGWNFGVGLSLLDTEIKDVVLPSTRVADRQLPLAPDTSINALMQKVWPAFGGEFRATVDYVWMDDHFSEALNNPSGLIESYGLANARLSFLTGSGSWELGLIVRNLTDEDILVYRTPIDIGFNQDHYARPRWITGQVIYHWR